jgi:hypothetical protein
MIEEQFGLKIETTWSFGKKTEEEKYKADVRRVLVGIVGSRAGQALAKAIKYWTSAGQEMFIAPYPFKDDNAQESGVSDGLRTSQILFTPGSGMTPGAKLLPGGLPKETLHHEMVHGLRRISGHMQDFRTRGQLEDYHLTEEFVAILATNIFISDSTNRRKSGLRANHYSGTKLPADQENSYKFFSQGFNAFYLIERFCQENPVYTKALASVPARFNPIAAYYKNRRRAFEEAANGTDEYLFQEQLEKDDYQKGFYQDGSGTVRRTLGWNVKFDPQKKR